MFLERIFRFSTNINDEGINIQLLVPGYGKEDLSLKVVNGEILVSVIERQRETSGGLSRSFPVVKPFRIPVGDSFDLEETSARVSHGVLSIKVPFVKKQPKNYKEIPLTD